MTIECYHAHCPYHGQQAEPICPEKQCWRPDMNMADPIHFWADGTWCRPDELEQMSHMSDDYGLLDAGPAEGDEDLIDEMVRKAVSG